MTSPYPIPVIATQVGTYFVGQYYQVLKQQPHLVHQFYSDSSTMVRLDGNNRETATGILQIHVLVMSLNITRIEIKTSYSLESWNGGVLVMVSGAMQVKDFNSRRKFVQTFFLAPQDKGYFVLNDIFHYNEEEQIHQLPAILLAQYNLDLKLDAFVTNPEPVPSYMLGGDIRGQELLAPVNAKENGLIDKYSFPEQQLRQDLESESIVENSCVQESNGSFLHTVNTVLEHVPPAAEEPVGEPQKQTYASILRVPKGQPASSVVPQVSVNMNTPPASDSDHDTNHTAQQPVLSSNAVEVSNTDIVDEISPAEYEGEIKSVYVRNLPTTVSESEIMEEFKKFGEISPDGVVIRSRKDVSICYAFVEFEDTTSVRNAVKAGSAEVAGQQVYIEERRPNSYIPSRGGRRGRGRGAIQWKLQGDVSAVEVMAGAVPTTGTIKTTLDYEETDFTGRLLAKIESCPGIKYLEMDILHRFTASFVSSIKGWKLHTSNFVLSIFNWQYICSFGARLCSFCTLVRLQIFLSIFQYNIEGLIFSLFSPNNWLRL